MEWYHGRLIAYSLGNFLGNGTLSIGGVLGISASSTSRSGKRRLAHADLTPVRLVAPGVPELDPAEPRTASSGRSRARTSGATRCGVMRTDSCSRPRAVWITCRHEAVLVLLAVAVVVAGGVAGATSSRDVCGQRPSP